MSFSFGGDGDITNDWLFTWLFVPMLGGIFRSLAVALREDRRWGGAGLGDVSRGLAEYWLSSLMYRDVRDAGLPL